MGGGRTVFRKNEVGTHPPWPVQCRVHGPFSVVDLMPGTESLANKRKGYAIHVSAWLDSR